MWAFTTIRTHHSNNVLSDFFSNVKHFLGISATMALFEKPCSPSLSGGICGISEMSLVVRIGLPGERGVVAEVAEVAEVAVVAVVAGVTLLWCNLREIESRREKRELRSDGCGWMLHSRTASPGCDTNTSGRAGNVAWWLFFPSISLPLVQPRRISHVFKCKGPWHDHNINSITTKLDRHRAQDWKLSPESQQLQVKLLIYGSLTPTPKKVNRLLKFFWLFSAGLRKRCFI